MYKDKEEVGAGTTVAAEQKVAHDGVANSPRMSSWHLMTTPSGLRTKGVRGRVRPTKKVVDYGRAMKGIPLANTTCCTHPGEERPNRNNADE